MDSLQILLSLLNDSDKKSFKNYLNSKNKRHDVKNISLLKLLETDDILNIEKLYKDAKNKDAYHALRKRLYDNLLLFLSEKVFNTTQDDYNEILKLYIVSKFLLEHEHFRIAFKCIRKAIELAKSAELYNLIHDLVSLQIQYAHTQSVFSLDTLFKELEENYENMQRESRLNTAYAYIRNELTAIHNMGKLVNLNRLLIDSIKKYKILESDLMSFKSLYQILYIANDYANIQQDFELIERYVKRTTNFLDTSNRIGLKDKYYYISILYYLANYYFRLMSFDVSSNYLKRMHEQIVDDTVYFKRFGNRYTLLLALNYFYTGQATVAIDLVRKSVASFDKQTRSEDVEDLKLVYVSFLAQLGDRTCLKELALLQKTDAWYIKNMGMLWTIRKSVVEIIAYSQFSDSVYASARIISFKRRFKKYLVETKENRVLEYVDILEKCNQYPNSIPNKSLQVKIFALWNAKGNTDIFVRSFVACLIAKIERKEIYTVILERIKV